MSITLKLPCIVEARKDRMDTHILYDGLSDLAIRLKSPFRDRWSKGFHGGGQWEQAQAVEMVTTGDLSGVAASDAYLSRFEDQFHIDATGFAIVADVAGSMPNIPAYLAGQPLAMRRRARVQTQAAPLVVVVDLSSSADISAHDLQRRGAAILALVRILSARRPVTLWAGVALGNANKQCDYNASWVRMDTAPLDLARSAYVMTDPAFARGLLYGATMTDCAGNTITIKWAYSDPALERRTAHANLARIFATNGETLLAIPAAHSRDDAIAAPEKWLADMITRYGTADAIDVAA